MSGNVYQMHIEVNPLCAPAAMENAAHRVHATHIMVPKRKPKAKAKPAWRPSNLRQWRESAGKTLEDAAAKFHLTHGQLSRIERGLSPWNQKVLEMAALEYGCSILDLLVNEPGEARRVAGGRG